MLALLDKCSYINRLNQAFPSDTDGKCQSTQNFEMKPGQFEPRDVVTPLTPEELTSNKTALQEKTKDAVHILYTGKNKGGFGPGPNDKDPKLWEAAEKKQKTFIQSPTYVEEIDTMIKAGESNAEKSKRYVIMTHGDTNDSPWLEGVIEQFKHLMDKGRDVTLIFLKSEPTTGINPAFFASWFAGIREKFGDNFEDAFNRIHFCYIGSDADDTKNWKETFSVSAADYIWNIGSAMDDLTHNAKGNKTAGYQLLEKAEETKMYNKRSSDDNVLTVLTKKAKVEVA